MRKRLFLLLPLALLLALLAAGCKPPAELAGIHRVAVLTLDNYTTRQELGSEIKYELLSQIPGRIAVEVIDGAAVEAKLPPNGFEAAMGDPKLAAELGRTFGVDAFVLGSATTYEEGADRNLSIELASGKPLLADFSVELTVRVAFNLRLIRASDGSSLGNRAAVKTEREVLRFGLTHPFISFELSAMPRFKILRQQAIETAVAMAIRDLTR